MLDLKLVGLQGILYCERLKSGLRCRSGLLAATGLSKRNVLRPAVVTAQEESSFYPFTVYKNPSRETQPTLLLPPA